MKRATVLRDFKATQEKNANPIADYLEGQAPADVKQNKDFIFTMGKKVAYYAALNQGRTRRGPVRLKSRASSDMCSKISKGSEQEGGQAYILENWKKLKRFGMQKLYIRQVKRI